jgi:OmpA-OmpF porin, OOP family
MLMFTTRFTRATCLVPRGNVATPVLLIFAGLAVSGTIFFVVNQKRIWQNTDAEAALVALKEEPAIPPPAPVATPAVPAPVKPTPPAVIGFARPADLAEQIARSLAAGDMEAAVKILAAQDPALEGTARTILEKMQALGFKPAPADQVQTLGQIENAMRLSIPLQKLDGQPTDARIIIDVIKDDKMGWKVGTLRLPKELESALAEMPAATPPAPGAPATTMKPLFVVDNTADALTFASDFVRALLKPDYDTARKLVDETKVPATKLAGLCIVFEDGQYELQARKPLVATVATETTSWIIAKIESKQATEATEFGLEMEKSAAGWKVVGLNLSQLLTDSSKASAQIGLPYTPLVKNPKGGESIALYYEYDQATLHPRAQKQLAIVASILKSSPGKKLKIGGYTDAKGTDDYNLTLSKNRAEAVKQFFLDAGVPLGQVETLGFGKADPLSPNANPDGTDNPEGRSLNRRAEILLDF